MIINIVVTICEWLLSKLGVEIWDWIKAYRIKEQAKADAKNLANAKTDEERAEVAKSISEHLNQ